MIMLRRRLPRRNDVDDIFRMLNYVVLCTLISWFGLFANTVNMIVFYRQGFNTTTDISFFALAMSDMFCCMTCQWFVVCLNPYVEKADIDFIPEEIEYLCVDWLHVASGRITSWITVFVTAERCLGITLSLKVKQIVTIRRTKVIIYIIFSGNIATILPEYAITYWDWKFVPAKNRSMYGLVYRDNNENVYGLTYTLTSASEMLSLFLVIILTIFLVTKLSQKSNWRKQNTAVSDNSDNISSRDKKTVKMIIIIATILITCYTPGSVLLLISTFVPEFNVGLSLNNCFYSFWSIAFVGHAINSSVNVLLYYRMSTKYRQIFDKLFSKCRKSSSDNI
jgi:hypothetical protein